MGIGYTGPALAKLGLKQRRIEFGQHLPGLDPVIEIGAQPLERAGHLRAHVHQHHGIQRAVGGDRAGDVSLSTSAVR